MMSTSATLELQHSLTDPHPIFHKTIPNTAEEELCLLSETFAASLASLLIGADYPDDPWSLREALYSSNAYSWHAGIQEELASLSRICVYKLVQHYFIPENCQILWGKCVFWLKHNEAGTAVCHKTCLVVKGFEQVFGQDYVETTHLLPVWSPSCLTLEVCFIFLNFSEWHDRPVHAHYLSSLLD